MSNRVLTTVAQELLKRHAEVMLVPCECFRCRAMHDLLDSRKERDEARKLALWMWALVPVCPKMPADIRIAFDAAREADAERAEIGEGR